MPVDILPDFQTPMVVSFYSYPGMPTSEMEKSVAESIERLLTLAGGMEHQESRSVPGASVLKIAFHPGTKPHAAMNDVVNLENNGLFQLPPGIEYPFTLRSEPGNLAGGAGGDFRRRAEREGLVPGRLLRRAEQDGRD